MHINRSQPAPTGLAPLAVPLVMAQFVRPELDLPLLAAVSWAALLLTSGACLVRVGGGDAASAACASSAADLPALVRSCGLAPVGGKGRIRVWRAPISGHAGASQRAQGASDAVRLL